MKENVVRRRKREAVPTVKCGGGSIMQRGCFSLHLVLAACSNDRIIKCEDGIKILDENLKQSQTQSQI